METLEEILSQQNDHEEDNPEIKNEEDNDHEDVNSKENFYSNYLGHLLEEV